MDFNLFDTPPIRSILFYPRPAKPLPSRQGNIVDGYIPIEDAIKLGYRLYVNAQAGAPLLLLFHGNGEIAADYDTVAREFLGLGLSLLVVDFRGYGWSSGEPRVATLTTDAEPVMAAIPALREEHGLPSDELLVMGRSLGSAPAIHAAYTHPTMLKGLILESAFAQLPPVLARLGLPLEWQANLPDPIGNLRKMQRVELPLLVIHGQRDTLIAPANGQRLHEASPTRLKHLALIEGVGHNNLMVKRGAYFGAIRDFLAAIRQADDSATAPDAVE